MALFGFVVGIPLVIVCRKNECVFFPPGFLSLFASLWCPKVSLADKKVAVLNTSLQPNSKEAHSKVASLSLAAGKRPQPHKKLLFERPTATS